MRLTYIVRNGRRIYYKVFSDGRWVRTSRVEYLSGKPKSTKPSAVKRKRSPTRRSKSPSRSPTKRRSSGRSPSRSPTKRRSSGRSPSRSPPRKLVRQKSFKELIEERQTHPKVLAADREASARASRKYEINPRRISPPMFNLGAYMSPDDVLMLRKRRSAIQMSPSSSAQSSPTVSPFHSPV